MSERLLIKSHRVVARGTVEKRGVLVNKGKIEALVPFESRAGQGIPIEDLNDMVVMAGLVDSHVHVNEPGRTEWEGYATATSAALAGGVTTIVDMPLNCIPVTTNVAAFEQKLNAVKDKLSVDCAFWGGVVPGNAGDLKAMAARGARGFKAFLCPSGIDDFPQATEKDLREAMPILAALGLPLLLHAELCDAPSPEPGDESPRAYRRYLDSRPAKWELDAIELAIRLCAEFKCRTHIVHLSAAEAVPLIREAKRRGAPLTAETCPHYLTFEAEEIEAGRTEFKCAPPIRGHENREALWAAVKDGTIDMIVSDHSPCLPELKKLEAGDFAAAWGGISGLQFTLPAAWTGLKKRGGALPELSRLVSEAPAALAGLPKKGKLEPGMDADLVIWDPEAEFTVYPDLVKHKHKLTPYTGRTLRGAVKMVFVRGQLVLEGGRVMGGRAGKPLIAQED